MHYSEFHNHKWAKNLAHARALWQSGEFEKLYRGEDLPENDVFPGLRVMAAYWTSVTHEMPLRLAKLLKGSGHADWLTDPEITKQTDEYFDRYLADMRELVARGSIIFPEYLDALIKKGLTRPNDWPEQMHALQERSEHALTNEVFPEELFLEWLDICLRSVAGYNHDLIQIGVTASFIVTREGEEALHKAVDAVSEEFMWEISREFFGHVMPSAGFEDLGDIMELGLRGMFSDQYYCSGAPQEDGEKTIRRSILRNCELAGILHAIEQWNHLKPFSLGYSVCRFDEVHGLATMMITMPPMVSPSYKLVKSLAYGGDECVFELTTVPAEDMERMILVQEKVFGGVDES